MKAILIIDHGSVLAEANNMLECVGNLVRELAGPSVIVRVAHLELAEPTIAQGFAACVEAGATEVVAFPYMLSPGKHSTRDIPRLVQAASRAHPHVAYHVTPAFGIHDKLAEVVLERSGVLPRQGGGERSGRRCVRPPGRAERYCGEGCPEMPGSRPEELAPGVLKEGASRTA